MSSKATPGSVSLVGAGPGDPDLLTVQAIKAIRRATVLLVDDLVGAGVLRALRARRQTRRMQEYAAGLHPQAHGRRGAAR